VLAVHIEIDLEADGPDRCRATVAYTYSALNALGNERVDAMTEERYVAQMVEWERALNHYVSTGERLGNY
jgi:hypothetical protein